MMKLKDLFLYAGILLCAVPVHALEMRGIPTTLTLKAITGNGTAPSLDLTGSTRVTGSPTSVLTGSIDATASTAVVGVGTLFTTELIVGDRITVSAETRTVTVITDNTNLTVDTAFTDTANDTSPDKLAAILVARNSSGANQLVINDIGNLILTDGTVKFGVTTLVSAGNALDVNNLANALTYWRFSQADGSLSSPNNYSLGNISGRIGKIYLDYTNTATVGAVTINKAVMRVNIAAAGTSVVVTNSLVTAASLVLCNAVTNDATARVTSVVPAAGSFTLNTVATTAQTAFGCQLTNTD
jgi:hypothetical protein